MVSFNLFTYLRSFKCLLFQMVLEESFQTGNELQVVLLSSSYFIPTLGIYGPIISNVIMSPLKRLWKHNELK